LAQLYSPKGTPGTLNAWLTPSTADSLEVADAAANRNFLPGATFESGGAGLVASAPDYLRFAQMLLNGGELGGVRLLAPSTVAMMARDHLGEVPKAFGSAGSSFGLNLSVLLDPGHAGTPAAAGTYGWGGAAGTNFWVDPANNMVGLFMVQSLPHRTDLAQKFRVLAYQALVEQ